MNEPERTEPQDERKRADETRRLGNAFADIIIDSIPGVFYVLDSQGRFVRWNRVLEEVTGLTAEMLLGTDALRTVFADDRQLVADKIRTVFEKGQAEIEARILGKDEVREFWFTGRRMDIGPISYLVGSGVDITDRKRAEQAVLRLNEQVVIAAERERTARETAKNLEIQTAIGAILHDSQESISLLQFLERVLDRLLAISWIALESQGAIYLIEGSPGVLVMKAQRGLPPPIIDQCRRVAVGRCLCGRAAATRRIEFVSHVDEHHETSYPDMPPHGHYCIPMISAGEVVGVILCYVPAGHARNTDEERFLAAVADVLAGAIVRRQAENSLREREQRYRELLAAVTNYTYSVKFENGMPVSTDHSGGCLSVTGYTPKDYQSDPCLWINMVHPDDRDAVRRYAAAILGDEKVSAIEHRILRRDGAIRWLRNTIVPHRDGDALVRYDGMVEDVTDRRSAENALRDREMQLLVAQKIQEQLLPKAPPALPGFDVGGGSYPAEFAAGDFFDYLTMPNGTVGFVISDVSGHGFGPALLMAATSTLLRLLAETETDLSEIFGRVNRFLIKETDDHFVTLFLGCLDPRSRSFVYASGGHPIGYVIDTSGIVKAHLASTAPPLAISAATEFPAAEPVTLEPGDIVLLVTDGIQEAMSPTMEQFGTKRLLEVLNAHRAKKAARIVENLYRAVCEFSQREKPIDDVTMIVIKVEQ